MNVKLFSDDDETVTMEENAPTILENLRFLVQRFENTQSDKISCIIEEYGGSIVQTVRDCDHIIVPLAYEKKRKINEKEVKI